MTIERKGIIFLLMVACCCTPLVYTVSAVHYPLWQIMTVDSGGDVGQFCSLALRSTGGTDISYRDETNGNLKIALGMDNAPKFLKFTVHFNGLQSSLAMDSKNMFHWSYYDPDKKDLCYVFDKGIAETRIDTAGDVGMWNSIAVINDERPEYCGHPVISYYDSSHTALKFVSDRGGSWYIETVDDSGDVGMHNSLALDDSGLAHISYWDSTNLTLKYAYQDPHQNWYCESLDDVGGLGVWSSIELDASGRPHISYNGDGELRYAWKDAFWVTHIETVDSSNNAAFTSLGLDHRRYPHISYYDFQNQHLNYAWKDESGWHIRTIDTSPQTGWHTSLALDSHENVHVAYYDSWKKDLRYAWTGYTIGVFRPSASQNWILDYEINRVTDVRDHFGAGTDIPLTGDFNNDDVADRAVFRNGEWIFDYSFDGFSGSDRDHYGMAGDIPLTGDFNNDGITDRAVFRPSVYLNWIIDYGMDGSVDLRNHYGMTEDLPLTGDFNNDDVADRAMFRRGEWIFDYNFDGSVDRRDHFGVAGDIPITGQLNYDGYVDQAIWDRAVFRNGQWIIDYSIDGTVNDRFNYGISGDIPFVY